MNKYLLIGLLSLLTSAGGYGQGQQRRQFAPLDNDSLKRTMYQTIHKLGIPGMAVAIYTSDRVLNEGAVGLRRLHTTDSLQLTDLQHLGSNSKAMTGFIAGRLVERGLIAWDTRFFDIFPELKDSSDITYQNITLNQLLSHRARVLPFTEDGDSFLESIKGKDKVTRRYNFCKWLLRQPPVKIDSTVGYFYSNAGYAAAALMMEKVTGKIWDKLVADELFTPLHVNGFIGWPGLVGEHQPWGHEVADGDSLLTPHSPHDKYKLDEIIAPAGDYSMSIPDYVKYLQLNLAGINGKSSILKASTFEYLHYCNVDASKHLPNFYSIGWGTRKLSDGNTGSMHAGSAGTFFCYTFLVKELNFGITVVVNSGDTNAQKGIGSIFKWIANSYGVKY